MGVQHQTGMTSVVADISVSLDGYVAGPTCCATYARLGAFVMGRNMFGGGEGPWDSEEPWEGWWGDEPPFHRPVFVLTHHAREPLPKEGGTTFTFVTEGVESAVEQARPAAGDRDVLIAGGGA